jgi:hypothetical protein
MTFRRTRIALATLLLAVAGGLIYVRILRERIIRLGQPESSERQAARELAQPAGSPDDKRERVKLFWVSAEQPGELAPVEVALALPADPVGRSKQLIEALIAHPPSPERRALPADAALLEFYLLEDGTAIADFSGALAGQMPSGILTEQLAVDSIVHTLEANVPQVQRLKILIQGQEVDTLAGHLDLTGLFTVRVAALPPPAAPPPPAKAESKPAAAAPALTPQGAAGTLKKN